MLMVIIKMHISFSNISQMTEDKLAPIVVTPNIAREGTTTWYNNGNCIFKEYVSVGGMTLFSLNPKPLFGDESYEDRKFLGLALDQRDHIKAMFATDGGHFQSAHRMK